MDLQTQKRFPKLTDLCIKFQTYFCIMIIKTLLSLFRLRNLDSVHSDIAKLLKRLQDENIRIGNKTISQVTFANAIFIDDHMELKKSYENAVNDLYKGYIKKLDFTNGFATIEHINK